MSTPDPVDLDFISIRHKLLDVAAFLDRVERSGASDDFRIKALLSALPLLLETGSTRAHDLLNHFSDPSEEPIEAAHEKGACGAVPIGESS